MQYPDIGRYRETLLNPHGLFRTLGGIEAGKDHYGDLFFIAGSNSVIFRAHMSGRAYALKCYTRHNPGLGQTYQEISGFFKDRETPYFSVPEYLEDEIYVFGEDGNGGYYPVVISEYAEGVTLRGFLSEKCAIKDSSAIRHVSVKFDELAIWLLEQDFAHGDIKPDNLIVTPDGEMRLIDFDGVFLPQFKGSEAPELGTRPFQHPSRNKSFFNRHIDDFSLALISVALHALAEFPAMFAGNHDDENLLFNPSELVSGNCHRLAFLKNHWLESGQTALYDLARSLQSPTPHIDLLADRIISLTVSGKEYGELGERGSMAIISKNGFFGYRNEVTGEIIEPVYDEAKPFGEGLAAVRIMKKWSFIDKSGKVISKPGGFDDVGVLKDGLAIVKKGGKFGFIDRFGKIIVYLLYDHARNFNEGLAGVKQGDKYGFIDREGNMAIDAAFDSVLDFREGLAVAGTNGKFGYVGKSGDFVIMPQYDFASGFRNGKALAEKNGETVILARADYY